MASSRKTHATSPREGMRIQPGQYKQEKTDADKAEDSAAVSSQARTSKREFGHLKQKTSTDRIRARAASVPQPSGAGFYSATAKKTEATPSSSESKLTPGGARK